MNNKVSRPVAFICVAASSICFGIAPIFVKRLTSNGMDTVLCALYRMILEGLLAGLIALISGQSFRINRKQLLSVAFFGIMGYGLTLVLLPTSYGYIDMGMATMCHFVYPVLVSIAMIIVFKEKLNKYKGIAIALALLGLFSLMKANSSGKGSIIGVLIAVSSGITYGLYVVSQEKTAVSQLNSFVMVFYVSIFCSLFYLAFLSLKGTAIRLPNGKENINLVIASILGMFAIVLLNIGVHGLGSSTAAFINMLEPITNIIADLVLFAAIPGKLEWTGCVLMLGAIFMVCYGNLKTET